MQLTSEQKEQILASGGRFLSESEAADTTSAILDHFPWSACLDPWAFLDEETSDYPVVVRAGPIKGYVVHFRHDDEPVVLARSIEEYFVGFAASEWFLRDSMLPPIGPRSDAEEQAGQQLVAWAAAFEGPDKQGYDQQAWAGRALACGLIEKNIGLLMQLEQQSCHEAGARLSQLGIDDRTPVPPWPTPSHLLVPEQP